MPEIGKYEKLPRPSTIEYFEKMIGGAPVVSSLERVETQFFRIKKRNNIELYVYLTNSYIVSEIEVFEILESHPNTNAIVTAIGYNTYSIIAKNEAKKRGVALFVINEFQGAIYYDGDRFINYIPPKKV